MGLADSILKQQDAILRAFLPQDRTVFKRSYTQGTGDALIGRTTTATYVDTQLDPQPTYERMTRYVVGPSALEEMVEAPAGNTREVANRYMVTVSATALSRTEIESDNLVLVYKDDAGNEEVFSITDYEPVAFQGTIVGFTLYAESMVQP